MAKKRSNSEKPPYFDYVALGKALIAYREENNVSFTDIQKSIGIDRNTLHRVETGLPCNTNNTLAICYHIGKSFTLFIK